MNDLPFEPDEIGPWSEVKLEIIEKYGPAYIKAFKNYQYIQKYYIDGFSGAGLHRSKATGETIQGSPSRALNVYPPFDHFWFIDLNSDKTEYLRTQTAGRNDVDIHTGDTNEYLTQSLLPQIKRENYKRALCVLDPYGLQLDWSVMLMAGQSGAIDMFLNFPVMDMNRTAFWRNPDQVPQKFVQRMNKFWGDESWREIGYTESRQTNLPFLEPDIEKQPNAVIANAFKNRLKNEAGFQYVAEPLAMRNSQNAIVYYLFFASSNLTADTIISDIFKKYR